MKKKLLLLIVEKNERWTQFKKQLETNDFEVISANDGQSGFDLARKTEPNLILATMQLQQLDGIDLCYMIRQNTNLSSIPYILISDDIGPEERINAFRSGVDSIVPTTISLRELSTRIETLIKRFELATNIILQPNQSMVGTLKDFRLVEILQMLNMNMKSGMLTVYHQSQRGQIAFFEGNMTWAKLDKTMGQEVVQNMVFWKEGVFVFEKDLIQSDANIQKPTMQLILDCCQLIDETSIQTP